MFNKTFTSVRELIRWLEDKNWECGSLEAFEKAADGKATKIIIPSNIQSLAGLVTSATEISKDVK